MGRPDGRLCLTCGGPAVLCFAAGQCVALGVTALQPPRPNADVFTRTPSPFRGAVWIKTAATVAAWLPVVFVLRSLSSPAAALLVFAGVPYAYVVTRVTIVLWRVKKLSPPSMPWMP
jgi:hypothetical protein